MPHSPSITVVISPHQEHSMMSHLESAVTQLRQTWVDVCQRIKHDGYPMETLFPCDGLLSKHIAENNLRRNTELRTRGLAPTHEVEPAITTAVVSKEDEPLLKEYELIIDFITEIDSESSRIRKRFYLHKEPPFREILESLFSQKSSKRLCVFSVYHNKSNRIINIAQEPYQSVSFKEIRWHPSFFIEPKRESSKPSPVTVKSNNLFSTVIIVSSRADFTMDRNPLEDQDDELPSFTAG